LFHSIIIIITRLRIFDLCGAFFGTPVLCVGCFDTGSFGLAFHEVSEVEGGGLQQTQRGVGWSKYEVDWGLDGEEGGGNF